MASHWNPCSGSLLTGRAQAQRVVDRRDVALPSAMAELEDVLAVVFVHRLAERAPERDAIVADDRGVVRQDAPARMHRHERRDDRAHAAARELDFPVDPRLRAGAVVVVEPARDVRAENAVLDREIAERERRKDLVVCHE